MVVANERLYAYDVYSNTFAYYSPHSNTWCMISAPNVQPAGWSLVHFEDKFYMMGNKEIETQEYDPETQIWTSTGYNFNTDLWFYRIMVLGIRE